MLPPEPVACIVNDAKILSQSFFRRSSALAKSFRHSEIKVAFRELVDFIPDSPELMSPFFFIVVGFQFVAAYEKRLQVMNFF